MPVSDRHPTCEGGVVPPERARVALTASAADDTAPREEFTMDMLTAIGYCSHLK